MVLYLSSQTKNGRLVCPAFPSIPVKGMAPLEEDKLFMGGLYLSCPARAYLENMRYSRARKGSIARTVSRKEIEERLEILLQSAGEDALQNVKR